MQQMIDRRTSDASPLEAMVGHAVGTALDRRFRQMTATAVVVAVLAALLISLPLTIWVNSETEASSHRAAGFNCDTLKSISSSMSSFVYNAASLRRKESSLTKQIQNIHPGVLSQLLADPEYRILSNKATALENKSVDYWSNVVAPKLAEKAQTDCEGIG